VAPPVLGDQLRQVDLLGQRERRDQPGIRDQIRVIERDIHRARGMRRLHLAGCFLHLSIGSSAKSILPGQAAPASSFPANTPKLARLIQV
jgi:hypothetical protein